MKTVLAVTLLISNASAWEVFPKIQHQLEDFENRAEHELEGLEQRALNYGKKVEKQVEGWVHDFETEEQTVEDTIQKWIEYIDNHSKSTTPKTPKAKTQKVNSTIVNACGKDEAKNLLGPNRCSKHSHCDGKRTCSGAGWCMGNSECTHKIVTKPVDSSAESCNNELKNIRGKYKCSKHAECSGKRTCSKWGWCHGQSGCPKKVVTKPVVHKLVDSSAKSCNNELLNVRGKYKCSKHAECSGKRTCSKWGWCHGVSGCPKKRIVTPAQTQEFSCKTERFNKLGPSMCQNSSECQGYRRCSALGMCFGQSRCRRGNYYGFNHPSEEEENFSELIEEDMDLEEFLF